MMSSEAGYTTALMKTAQKLGKVRRISEDLPVALEIINSYSGFFKNPEIRAREKMDALSQLLSGRADELTIAFVVMLAQRGKLKYLPGVNKRFMRLADEVMGRAAIRVTFPYEPSGELMEKLKQHLIEVGMCRHPAEGETTFEVVVDKRIIGGFIAESDSKLVDLSIRTRLKRLSQTSIR